MKKPAKPTPAIARLPSRSTLTELLNEWREGGAEAEERLFEIIYPEIRKLAVGNLARESGDVSLDATDLVHECYLRMSRSDQPEWVNRAHFYAIAGRVLRQVLVDHARRRHRKKRGGDQILVAGWDLDTLPASSAGILDIHLALESLARSSPSAARVVELRCFSGLSIEETAEVLELGRTTVVRRWRFARAWLVAQVEAPATS